MRDIVVNVSALLVSISLLLLGNGLQMTLLGVRAQIEDFSTVITGFLTSAYFIGYILGALAIPKMVELVGHIRVFVALASISSISAILHPVMPDPYLWIVLRVITGFCLVGLYLVTESWLNEQSTNENRGQVFSAYMVINLASVAMGQQLLQLSDPGGYGLFILGTVLFSFAVVPISLMPARTPVTLPTERMQIKRLYRISPVGSVGAFMSGLVSGAFWGMGAVYLYAAGYETSQIANFMMIVVFGGMILQVPFGKISDMVDRRFVIIATCVGLVASGLFMMGIDPQDHAVLYIAAFFYGGFALTMNSLCTAHTNDFLEAKDFVQASGTLLLLFGAGAIVGPYIASLFMEYLGNETLFLFVAIVGVLFGIYASYRSFVRSAPKKRGPFRALPFATQHLVKLHRKRSKEQNETKQEQ